MFAYLAVRAVGRATVDELQTVHDQMEAMLKENGPPPTGERWEELLSSFLRAGQRASSDGPQNLISEFPQQSE